MTSEKAGLWQRVSTGEQDEAKQLADLERRADEHGYIVAERYVVHGKSAYHGRQQDALERVLADMAEGRITVLIAWAADRIERRGALAALTLAERARQAGGRIEYVQDAHLNAVNEMSDVMLSLSATIARQESKRKSDRTHMDIEHKRATGAAHGRPPWGYAIEGPKDGKRFVPTAAGRAYVPAIFDRVIAGESLRSIAAWLTASGVPTSSGASVWHEAYIGNRLIGNPVYRGERRNGGTLATEALVSATKWQQAQAALASRARPGRSGTVNPKPLVRPVCAACLGQEREGCVNGRSVMYRVWSGRGTSRRAYYRCSGSGPQRKGCGAPMIPVADLDAAVGRAMLADTRPHENLVFVPGDDRSDEIARLDERGAAAMRQGDYDAAMAAMAEAKRLRGLPRVAPHWRSVVTDETEGKYFGALSEPERRDYLARHLVIAERDGDGSVFVTVAPKADTSEPIRVAHADGSVSMMRTVEEMARTAALRERAARRPG